MCTFVQSATTPLCTESAASPLSTNIISGSSTAGILQMTTDYVQGIPSVSLSSGHPLILIELSKRKKNEPYEVESLIKEAVSQKRIREYDRPFGKASGYITQKL